MFEGGMIKKLGEAKKEKKKPPELDMDKLLKKENPGDHKHSINRILGVSPPKKLIDEPVAKKTGRKLFDFKQ